MGGGGGAGNLVPRQMFQDAVKVCACARLSMG